MPAKEELDMKKNRAKTSDRRMQLREQDLAAVRGGDDGWMNRILGGHKPTGSFVATED